MRPQLKDIDSSDVDDLATYKPADPTEVTFAVTLHIGPADAAGAHLFQATVCTPKLIGRQRRNLIVINYYSWDAVLAAIEERLAACADWPECLDELRTYYAWEYEGMG